MAALRERSEAAAARRLYEAEEEAQRIVAEGRGRADFEQLGSSLRTSPSSGRSLCSRSMRCGSRRRWRLRRRQARLYLEWYELAPRGDGSVLVSLSPAAAMVTRGRRLHTSRAGFSRTGSSRSIASSAARSAVLEMLTCSSAAWPPSPTGPRPSSVAVSKTGRVRVGASADQPGVLECESNVATEPLRGRKEQSVSRCRFHRWSADAAIHLERAPFHDRLQTANRPLELLRRHLCGDANADARGRLGRDDVRAQAAVDRADVDGDAVRGIVEREQLLDLVGELEDRAGSLLEARPRMRGTPVHGDLETADTFTCDLQPAFRAFATFEDEGAFGSACQRSDHSFRVSLPISSSVLKRMTGVTEGERSNARSARNAKTSWTSPAFMSYVPGPNRLSPSLRTGMCSERAGRPDRVHVPEYELKRRRALPCAGPRIEMITNPPASHPPDGVVELRELLGESREGHSLGACVQRRRLGDDEPLEQRDDLPLALVEPGEQHRCPRMTHR